MSTVFEPSADGGLSAGDEIDPAPAVDAQIIHLPTARRVVDAAEPVPLWIRSSHHRRQIAAQAWTITSITLSYAAVRAPWLLSLAGWWSIRGLWALVWGLTRWAFDVDGHPLLGEIKASDDRSYVVMADRRTHRQRWRLSLLAVGSSAVLLAFWAAWMMVPKPVILTALATLWVLLSVKGRPVGATFASPAVVREVTPKLTSQLVTSALLSLGIGAMAKGSITFPKPITEDGPGFMVTVDLPHGVTWGQVLDRRAQLASGLRRPLSCVWPGGDTSAHEGRARIWIGHRPLSETPAPAWPLRDRGLANVWEPVPFGFDQRLKPVNVSLVENNVLIGAIPGAGKTIGLRNLLLAASLDPHTELHVWDFKGGGDFSCLEPVAHRFGSGLDDDTVARCLSDLESVHGLLERRAGILRRLPNTAVPDNKLTEPLAKRHPDLKVLIFSIDECQELFTHPRFGQRATELCTSLIKRGRAFGVVMLFATQKPDQLSLPNGIRANVSVRFCGRVVDHHSAEAILGSGLSNYKPMLFTPADKGIGYLVGVKDVPTVTRTFFIDAVMASDIVKRARAARELAGNITGQAAGEIVAVPADKHQILSDLIKVWPDGQPKVWSETLVEHLVDLDPDRYGGWTQRDLAVALKTLKITTRQIQMEDADGQRANRRGITRADLDKALDRFTVASIGGDPDEA